MTKCFDYIITWLYKNINSFRDKPILKDTSRIFNIKFDAFIESSVSEPLSFTVFELSDKGELVIDDVTRVVESTAAFFLFVNTENGWVTAVRNTTENQKRLVRKEPIQNYKIKIINRL